MLEVIHGNVPSKSNSYRITTVGRFPRLYKTKQLKDYEKSFKLQCSIHKGMAIEGDFKLIARFFYPSRRSDLDNGLKCLLDVLESVNAFSNDNRCVAIDVTKHIDKDNPRVEFQVIPYTNEQTETN